MKPKNPLRITLLFALTSLMACAQEMKISPEMLQTWLKQYPDADTNKDGVLTETEARVYYARMLAAAPSVAPAPTRSNVRYGSDARNVFDFWQAKSDKPTPVVIYIYGGGFVSGDKSVVRTMKLVPQCLNAGVSVVAINYRYLAPGVTLPDVLHDCARAVQFVRSQAAELKIDKTRIASCGNSAGAGTSMWLAFHPDMADPTNVDPVLRESTRLCAAVSWDGQFTYDFPLWGKYLGEDNRQNFGGIYNSPGIYGLKSKDELDSPAGRKLRAECDFYDMISADDPPIYIGCGLKSTAVSDVNQYLHNPRHSQLLYERCRERGVVVVAKIPILGILPAAGDPPYGEALMLKYLTAK